MLTNHKQRWCSISKRSIINIWRVTYCTSDLSDPIDVYSEWIDECHKTNAKHADEDDEEHGDKDQDQYGDQYEGHGSDQEADDDGEQYASEDEEQNYA